MAAYAGCTRLGGNLGILVIQHSGFPHQWSIGVLRCVAHEYLLRLAEHRATHPSRPNIGVPLATTTPTQSASAEPQPCESKRDATLHRRSKLYSRDSRVKANGHVDKCCIHSFDWECRRQGRRPLNTWWKSSRNRMAILLVCFTDRLHTLVMDIIRRRY
ncbi:hypothetical protein BDP81DRAFT_209125 [Colletotrichum phormii]|uniref:Uncharacterized protein n=1 Tax=Colletotrichum phormii TaxID=359342 RepID=A0AAI9ZUS4_9PEZI|nr:uncharacterized protein BDP81DRAFT_209125 [Colletotrichum phormii]KAK1638536.1 hypothetical protein BDP81DRAFT_209125 [Colletotrichum phormii]